MIDDVPDLDRLPAHRALLERALDNFGDDDRVPGPVVGGSLASGGADFYSDVDLYVISRDEDSDAVFAERDAAGAIGSRSFASPWSPCPGVAGTT